MSFLRHFDAIYYPRLGRRQKAFREVLRLLEEMASSFYTIIETGSSRSGVEPDGLMDFTGIGPSTVLFDRFVNYYDGAVYSVNLSAMHCASARSMVGPKTRVICSDSVDFLRNFDKPERVACLYLNSGSRAWENPHAVALLNLKELCAVLARLAQGCIVVVDDNHADNGRHIYIKDLLHRLDAKLLFEDYQVAWQLSTAFCDFHRIDQVKKVEKSLADTVRYRYGRSDLGDRILELLPGGRILHGQTGREELWNLDQQAPSQITIMGPSGPTARLWEQEAGEWRGHACDVPGITVTLTPMGEATARERAVATQVANRQHYKYVRVGYDERPIELLANGLVCSGRSGCEQVWFIEEQPDRSIALIIAGSGHRTCVLTPTAKADSWRGTWLVHERMPIELHPILDLFNAAQTVAGEARCANVKSRKLHRLEVNGITLFAYDELESTTPKIVAGELSCNSYRLDRIPFRPGDIVIDIGAHVGLVSMYLAKRWPFLRIHAFEPHPANYTNCVENLLLNDVSNVAVTPRAVSGDGRSIVLRYLPANTGGSTAVFDMPGSEITESVESITLDTILTNVLGAKERCRLLKIDCEGMEYEILSRCQMLDRIDHLVGEFHEGLLPAESGSADDFFYNPQSLFKYCAQVIAEKNMRIGYCRKRE